MRRRLALLLPLLGVVAGCDQMDRQPRADALGESKLFADGKVDQAPPADVVAQDDPARAAALAQRPPMTPALLQRGRERYDIFCAECHDRAGYGEGIVVQRGFPKPPSLHDPRLRAASSRHLVDVIGQGYGVMYGYADVIAPSDRWAIAAYVRALQLSQALPAAELSADERRRLGLQ